MSEFPLLPSDRYIADLLGLSEEQYRYYLAEVRRRATAGPQPSVVATIGPDFFLYVAAISSLLSIGLTIAASFFKPRPQAPPRLQQNQTQGQSISNIRRYAPRQGFDSVQDVALIGEPIPLVYVRRERLGGRYYGGMRVNTPLIWSQLKASSKSQLLKAIFLIGEGHPSFRIDPANIAIGNNTLGSYLLGNSENARFTVYYRPDGGRLTAPDRIAGSSNDPGKGSDANVYGVPDSQGVLQSDFVHTHRPNTQTQFGVYALIGNGLGFRMNPSLRPGVNAQITVDVKGKKKKAKVEGRVVCELDYVAQAQRLKHKAKFSGRSGLIEVSGTSWTYHLSNTTDAQTVFSVGANQEPWVVVVETEDNPFAALADATVAAWMTVGPVTSSSSSASVPLVLDTVAASADLQGQADGTYIVDFTVLFQRGQRNIYAEHVVTIDINEDLIEYSNGSVTITVPVNDRLETHEELCGDVASAVSGRQKSWDDGLQVGELYKIGSALAICTSRAPAIEAFNSDADFEPIAPSQGNAINAEFSIIRPGTAQAIPLAEIIKDAKSSPPFYTATNFPHLQRIAIGSFSTIRECRIVEVCLRSSLGIRINGLCNFRDSLTYNQIDGRACLDKEGNKLNPGDYLTVDIFNSGQMSSSEDRYSFFRIRYREAGTQADYSELPQCFGIRGITQQNVFNDIRFVMPDTKRWEFQFEPLSGWEIRSGTASGDLELIDSSLSSRRVLESGGITVAFNGIVGSGGPFMAAALRASQGPKQFMLASVQRGARAEIGVGYSDENSYVDAWGKLAEAFVYEEVRSSAEGGPEHEIVAVNELLTNAVEPRYEHLAILGLNVRSGVEWQQFGQLSVYVLRGLANGTHLFPEILLDLFTNPRYGKGDQITREQIDVDSFTAATKWCRDRRLFFDGALVGRINLRQWAADVAATHLLFFGESAGRFWLKPAWPGSVANPEPVAIKGIFTAGNIQEGSFAMEFLEPEDRRPIRVSVKYREERAADQLNNPGLFAVEREVMVREAEPWSSATDPIEAVDLSDYVTSREHAIDAAKFIARMRRIPDHVVKFNTTHEGIVAALQPGDYIRVVMDVTHYDQLRNGAVLPNGALVTTQPLADGEYPVFAWDGRGDSPPQIQTLTVQQQGQFASPAGVVFTIVNAHTQSRTYQIERITPVEDGGFGLEAVYMPTTDTNILELAAGWDQLANWVIEG